MIVPKLLAEGFIPETFNTQAGHLATRQYEIVHSIIWSLFTPEGNVMTRPARI